MAGSSKHNRRKHRKKSKATGTSQRISDAEIESGVQRGTRTLLLLQVLSQIFSLCVLYVLYDKVSQQQFGLLGMVLPVIGLIRLVSSQSLSVASVQATEMNRQLLSNLFWATVALGLLSTLIGMAAAPFLEWFYGTPGLTLIGAALAGTALLGSLGFQHQAILEREMRVGRVAAIRFIALVVAGVAAVVAALNEWGVWALVLQQYVEILLVVVGVIGTTRFVPALPRNFALLKPFVQFGGNFFASNLIFNVGINIDKFVLPLLLGSSVSGLALVGNYTQAFSQMMKPVYLVSSPIGAVMFPALSRAAGDRRLFNKLTQNFFRLVGLILFPVGIGLFVVAEDAFLILGGEKWRVAGKVLTALSLAIIGQGLINISGSLFASTGRTGRLLMSAIITTVVYAIVFGISTLTFSLNGTVSNQEELVVRFAWTYTFCTIVVLLVPYLVYCLRSNGVSAARTFQALWKSLLPAVLMGLVCLAVQRLLESLEIGVLPRLVLVVLTGVGVFVALANGEIRRNLREFGSRQT